MLFLYCIVLVAFQRCQSQLIPLNDDEKQSIVDLHNKFRIEAGAAAMQKMKWNNELAQYAETAAGRCNFDHTSYESRQNIAGFPFIGENIYTMAGAVEQPTGNEAVDNWASEIEHYDINSNSCSAMCGHYTQIVWAATTDFGCALVKCGSVGGFSSEPGYLIFCNYGVGGNVIGEAPYEKAGSKSDIGSKCQDVFKAAADADGLCVSHEENSDGKVEAEHEHVDNEVEEPSSYSNRETHGCEEI